MWIGLALGSISSSCDRRVALIGTPPRFWNPCSRSVEAARDMTCQPRQRSRRVCRAGGYWRAARQFFETLRNRRTSCIEAAQSPKIFLLPARKGLQHRGRHPVAHPPFRACPEVNGDQSQPGKARTREHICRDNFRQIADREGGDGCGSMSERRRRKEEETPAVERAVNHSDTDSDSVDSESDHEGRCLSFCASKPCQYSVLCALSPRWPRATPATCRRQRAVCCAPSPVLSYLSFRPHVEFSTNPTQQAPRQMVDSVAGELGKRWTDSRLISSTSLWPPCS